MAATSKVSQIPGTIDANVDSGYTGLACKRTWQQKLKPQQHQTLDQALRGIRPNLAPAVGEGVSCYSQTLKADLLPGTFVLLVGRSPSTSPLEKDRDNFVAKIVAVTNSPSSSVSVKIFRRMKEAQQAEGFVHPDMLIENHLRQLTVQTAELRVIPTVDIVNLSFVFTMASLRDPSLNLLRNDFGIHIAI